MTLGAVTLDDPFHSPISLTVRRCYLQYFLPTLTFSDLINLIPNGGMWGFTSKVDKIGKVFTPSLFSLIYEVVVPIIIFPSVLWKGIFKAFHRDILTHSGGESTFPQKDILTYTLKTHPPTNQPTNKNHYPLKHHTPQPSKKQNKPTIQTHFPLWSLSQTLGFFLNITRHLYTCC